MKIINKSKKSDFITRDMRSFSGRFESVRGLKLKLMEEFDTLVPSSLEFDVGYFSGKQSKKQWLIKETDLLEMYDNMKKSKCVLLWCDRRLQVAEQPTEQKRKRSAHQDAPKTKRFELETDVEDIVTQLKDIQGDKFTIPQLRMWARYVQVGHYKDLVEPPPLPALKGVPPKRERKESLSDAIAGAAITFVNAMRSPESNVKANNSVVINAQTPPKNVAANSLIVGISPGRATELRMKKLKELRELQTLLEQNILNEAEFAEQKAIVLESLRKLQ